MLRISMVILAVGKSFLMQRNGVRGVRRELWGQELGRTDCGTTLRGVVLRHGMSYHTRDVTDHEKHEVAQNWGLSWTAI
jgi:hypothetical protein